MAGTRRGFAFKLELLRRMKQAASFGLHSRSAVDVCVLTEPSNGR